MNTDDVGVRKLVDAGYLVFLESREPGFVEAELYKVPPSDG